MNELELHEKIEAYLKNRLLPEERAAFEAEMNASPELATAVALHRDLMAATGEKDVLDLRRQMEEIYREQSSEKVVVPPSATLREMPQSGGMSVSYRRIVMAAAAAVLLGIVAVTVWKPWQQLPEAPIAQPGVPPSVDSVSTNVQDENRVADLPPSPTKGNKKPHQPQFPSKKQNSTSASGSRYLAMAEEAYQKSSEEWAGTLKSGATDGGLSTEEKAQKGFAEKDYAAVVNLLSTDSDTLSPVSTYLRGHANFRLEDYAAAAADFRKLLKDNGYSADAEWYLLLSLLAEKGADDPEAKQLLKQIRKSDEHPYHSDLQRLLPKIRSR